MFDFISAAFTVFFPSGSVENVIPLSAFPELSFTTIDSITPLYFIWKGPYVVAEIDSISFVVLFLSISGTLVLAVLA